MKLTNKSNGDRYDKFTLINEKAKEIVLQALSSESSSKNSKTRLKITLQSKEVI